MGWANCGTDSQGRSIGYAHEGTCDQPGCEEKIDRGLSFACGNMHGEGGNNSDFGCEKYFCEKHLKCGLVNPLCADCYLDALEIRSEQLEELEKQLNTPQLVPFMEAAVAEAKHQVCRWGEDHDETKYAVDWYWTLGHLAGKAVRAADTGDINKALHHTISSAALLANWHRRLLALRGGGIKIEIDPFIPENRAELRDDAGNVLGAVDLSPTTEEGTA